MEETTGSLSEIKNILKTINVNREQTIDYLERKYKDLVKNTESDEIFNLNPESEIESLALKTVYIGILFRNKKFEEINTFIEDNLKQYLEGTNRSYDFFIAKIVKYYYFARKILNIDNSIFFSYLVYNKELKNESTISVLTNCVLDMMISSHLYKRIENKINSIPEQAINNFYNGVIDLVELDYTKALENFHCAAILSKNKWLSMVVQKHIMITMLLKSDFNIPYKYSKKLHVYFEILSAVRNADIDMFDETLDLYKEELMSDNLYFIAQRIAQNVVQERIRRISVVYSRISYEDISKILNMEIEAVDYLIRKTIKQGIVKGKVEQNVFHSLKEDKYESKLGLGIKDSIYLSKFIVEQMKHPKIEPLSYDKISKQ